ncbi:MAG: hypothetical protein M3N95_12835 [Actinomycetota bacterium]|nr:hypothetical protein [Actinomycetota bacterium]
MGPALSTLAAGVAARAHRATDALHSLIYFVPEADEEFVAVGLRPGRMSYFASRSAPLGPVGTGTTTATFYNFKPALVATYIPHAWSLADPVDIIAARLRAAERALRRLLGDLITSAEFAEFADLARQASSDLPPEGRPLYAAHAQLPWPDDAHLIAWHAATLLREYRGDGHIAALLNAQLSGIEAIITHTATGRGFREQAAKRLRGWSDDEWADAVEGLRARGYLDAAGLTAEGVALRERIEADTDRLDTSAWLRLGEQRTQRLCELGKQFTRVAVDNGAFPAAVFASPPR